MSMSLSMSMSICQTLRGRRATCKALLRSQRLLPPMDCQLGRQRAILIGMTTPDRASIIADACAALARGDEAAAAGALACYPSPPPPGARGAISAMQATRIFMRDGFVCRYSGTRLVNPGALRILSLRFPTAFPYHPHGRIDVTHPAWWDLFPTVDHVVLVARGGKNESGNMVTTSLAKNAEKGSWTLDELGWSLRAPGLIAEWDGMTRWKVDFVAADGGAFAPYVDRWVRAARMET